MKSYGKFASFYDNLTQNVDYCELAEYFDGLIKQYGNGEKIVLDLACGTGNLALLLAEKNYDVVAVDGSTEMLAVAVCKSKSFTNPIFLHQTMQELDLFGTIDAAVCTLDSINHLHKQDDVKKTIERVSLFMNNGGVFIFDVNTLYKHCEILAQNAFVYDTEDVYCVWQNNFDEKDGSVEISLDFFEKSKGDLYKKSFENFKEYYYSDEFITKTVENSGMSVLKRFDGFSKKEVNKNSQRIVYVCRKD